MLWGSGEREGCVSCNRRLYSVLVASCMCILSWLENGLKMMYSSSTGLNTLWMDMSGKNMLMVVFRNHSFCRTYACPSYIEMEWHVSSVQTLVRPPCWGGDVRRAPTGWWGCERDRLTWSCHTSTYYLTYDVPQPPSSAL